MGLAIEKRRRILDAADELFSKDAFDKVKMDDIAEKSGVGKVSIYRYFSTKDELLVEYLREKGRAYLEKLHNAEASAKGCRKKLIALVQASMNFFYDRSFLLKLLDRAGIDHDRQVDFPWLDAQQQSFRMLKSLLAEGIAKREFEVHDLELAVRGLIGAMRIQLLYPADDVKRREIPERIVETVILPVGGMQLKAAA
jgi:AcrR family transcriptional regulator